MSIILGNTRPEILGFRDAVHVQVVFVESEDSLEPGQKVLFTDNTFKQVESCYKDDYHAIVDPFLSIYNLRQMKVFPVLIKPGLTSDPVHHYEMRIAGLPEVTQTDKDELREDQYRTALDDLKKQVDRLNKCLEDAYSYEDYSDGCGPGCG